MYIYSCIYIVLYVVRYIAIYTYSYMYIVYIGIYSFINMIIYIYIYIYICIYTWTFSKTPESCGGWFRIPASPILDGWSPINNGILYNLSTGDLDFAGPSSVSYIDIYGNVY